jgi:regulator of replication initiation timing
MEHTGKIVNRKENQDRTTYLLQVETSLRNANQDIKILKKAIDDLVRENVELRIKLSRMELA